MNNLSSQFENQNQPSFQQANVLAQASSNREMEEVKGAIFMARQFPRNVFQAEQRILDACKRPALAETAVYQYPRGGTKVTGPSIRLAEVIAQNWGNIDFGIKELEQRDDESVVMSYAWDLETNTRQTKVFTVKHSRKANGTIKKLDDPRDIYEKVANDGARRLRSCILAIVPGDIIDIAVRQCDDTLKGNSKGPLKDRIANALKTFKERYKVTQEMIETRFGYNADSFTEVDFLDLGKIFNSLKDGMSKVDDWFDKNAVKKSSSKLSEEFSQEENTINQPENKEVKEETNGNSDFGFESEELPL
jgi:hypothetical protein